MFDPTLQVQIDGKTINLVRINQDNFGSEYRFSDAQSSASLKIRHSVDKADKDKVILRRHNVVLDYIIFPTATTLIKKYRSSLTFQEDTFGDPTVGTSVARAAMNFATGAIDALVAGVN
uniref:Capsid protein n=1 Tax=Macrotermes bellicosus associated levi-like virus TaxID=3133500 RepID=A0AAT9JAG9_9VIRU